MKNYWNEAEAAEITSDLDMRVYTSQLLGKDMNLVMHGGGNTSVKSTVDSEEILYVKGSGWDLETILPPGFAPVKMKALMQMAELDTMSDMDMVKQQREAMIDPDAPNPSVEAILHAVIPYKFVDHTHADALVTLTNTPDGEALVKALYGDSVVYVPYVMPGFILAKAIYEQTKDLDWSQVKGMVLMNHGLFTFSDSAKEAYDNMVELAGMAEGLLQAKTELKLATAETMSDSYLAALKSAVANIKMSEDADDMVAMLNESAVSKTFAMQSDEVLSQVSVLTPDHIIRTKQKPAIFSGDESKIEAELQAYIDAYEAYFAAHKKDEICLNPAPNYAVVKGFGTVAFGKSDKEAKIISDINDHTFEAILRAQDLGGYQPLGDAELFEMEYWELEQAKLKK